MNTMINNPKRTVTINKPAKYVMDRLKVLGAWTGSHVGITISQASIDYNINSYEFTCDGFFTGFGNKGNVQVMPVNDNACTVTIEIGRTFGCIDDQWEAQLCNDQINSFVNLLSTLVGLNDEEITKFPTPEQREQLEAQSGGNGAAAVLGVLAFVAVLIWILI